jgi:hypothetical protein
MTNRRHFLQKVAAYGGLFVIGSDIAIAQAASTANHSPESDRPESDRLTIRDSMFKPLDTVIIQGVDQGVISVRDGIGQEYVHQAATALFSFQVGGAIGNHTAILQTESGKLLDFAHFTVNCKTEIRDADVRFYQLANILHNTMIRFEDRYASAIRLNSKDTYYQYFVSWIRDHVHSLKGLKYFYPELKSGIDLYADFQRDDGMIWDNIGRRTKEKSGWDLRFAYDRFILPIEDNTYEFKRIPVENDVEYLFIEGLYYTWKATGDSVWMASKLNHALKAIRYSTTDPYRWSRRYQLLKRGFTIDTWDFQSDSDIVRYIGAADDAMAIDKDKTRFGIMFGDNTGMAMSCRYLAEMLEHAGRQPEAQQVRQLGKTLMTRLNQLAWNGQFFTHHIPEDPTVQRDLGVDQSQQVSLSNAYSINRDLTHEQCVAIIETYQRIRQSMPSSSPGEWYSIYPPFQKGFRLQPWVYMNGGVTAVVAGELAHGAFEHGFEAYGVEILERLLELARQQDNYLPCVYRGSMPTPPKRQFTPLNLRAIANVDFFGTESGQVTGWTGEAENDLRQMPVGRQVFHEIPFEVIDPATNNRRACLGLSGAAGYRLEATLPVNATAQSIYLLQTRSGDALAGTLAIDYEDGSRYTDYIADGKISGFWFPTDPPITADMPSYQVAWRGANSVCPNIGVVVYGLNNPHPDKPIKALWLEGTKTSTKWMVLGITLCDAPVFFMPSPLSVGIPENWGAAAVFYALIEGLAGIKDTGVAFDTALLTPRWLASSTHEVTATAKYEASGGYLSYRYKFDPEYRRLWLTFTGSARETKLEVLLPNAQPPAKTMLDGKAIDSTIKTVETSTYACLTAKGLGVHTLELTLA